MGVLRLLLHTLGSYFVMPRFWTHKLKGCPKTGREFLGNFCGLELEAIYNTSAHIPFTRRWSYSFLYGKLARKQPIDKPKRQKEMSLVNIYHCLCRNPLCGQEISILLFIPHVEHIHLLLRKTQSPTHSLQSVESSRTPDDAVLLNLTHIASRDLVTNKPKREIICLSLTLTACIIAKQGQCNCNKHSHLKKEDWKSQSSFWYIAILKSYDTDITNLVLFFGKNLFVHCSFDPCPSELETWFFHVKILCIHI